ncbi:hypothetical protein N658DRAFT_256405 [Parathielavia hyrcaniae]|uniref:Uncharacterized protein n=1 Tax=Parathielavia hyrcaniae TaxID=113614 RepID=A0AAN6PUB9_9PEZI|nr:hypothetical protein N658DRAFT_256405 [Parathielavia hyrcaniae]
MPDDRYAQFFWSNERLDSLLASAVRKQYTSPRFLNVQVLWPSFPRFDILVAAALDKRRRWHRAAAGIGCHRHRPVDAAARDQSESCHDLKWLAGLACGINKRETTGRQEARRHIGVVLTSMRLDRRPERASKGDQDCFSVAATFSSVSREAHARPFLSTG